MNTAPWPPTSPEFDALTVQSKDKRGLDSLTQVGEALSAEVGGDEGKDSRKNKKLPKKLAALVLLRTQGFDNREIADKLGVTPRTVKALIAKAMREYGWSDLADTLTNVAVPLAMESVLKHLEHEGSALGVLNGQSTMTRATLAGTGVFKSHSAVKQESKSENTNILRVEIALPQMPPGVQALALADGSVLATPRRALPSVVDAPAPAASIEGEVIK